MPGLRNERWKKRAGTERRWNDGSGVSAVERWGSLCTRAFAAQVATRNTSEISVGCVRALSAHPWCPVRGARARSTGELTQLSPQHEPDDPAPRCGSRAGTSGCPACCRRSCHYGVRVRGHWSGEVRRAGRRPLCRPERASSEHRRPPPISPDQTRSNRLASCTEHQQLGSRPVWPSARVLLAPTPCVDPLAGAQPGTPARPLACRGRSTLVVEGDD